MASIRSRLRYTVCLEVAEACSHYVRDKFLEARYKYHAKSLGMPLEFNRRVDFSNILIERARLEVTIPILAFGSGSQHAPLVSGGWVNRRSIRLVR